ncbi:MAG: HD domain-containing protein [Thermoanaerobacterium sp.]|nr:HD domain-containing protein [Thermoanaerobacterium sp.]
MKEKPWEIRDPIYGFIEINEWERDIINHPVFQRLRMIRQLALTDLAYPGAVHTRFEHSLGVMHVATKVFDNIANECKDMLKSEYGLNEDGLNKVRTIIRLGTLHDVGHAPFHMPVKV